PPSIHAPLISSPEPLPNEQAIPHQSPYATDYGTYFNDFQRYGSMKCRQLLDEVEIRELLIDHIGHQCCWGVALLVPGRFMLLRIIMFKWELLKLS
ncbi:hypothetical protein Gohar_011095, partial [Gossypium harknessii]|nr:hypothetical protein [Gossypium harknessii]